MATTGIDSGTADLLHAAIHDLKGPASRLRLLAQLLTRSAPALDEDARGLLRHIEDSAAAVGLVADGLRNYVEICGRTVERVPLELGETAAAAIAGMRNQIESVGGQITQAGLPAVVADRFLMTWLLQELVANALRFRGDMPPRVDISAAAGGPGNWYVAVSDNGPGIEPAMAARVFLPFKKVSAGGGIGLGLTICRKIIHLHGGEMWIEPRESGAEFRFYVSEEIAWT